MSAFLDSSVLVAALASDENKQVECLALLLKGGNCIYPHALLETFSSCGDSDFQQPKTSFAKRFRKLRYVPMSMPGMSSPLPSRPSHHERTDRRPRGN